MNSHIIHYLARRPEKLLHAQATGNYPTTLTSSAESPLITLLESISPIDRLNIRGVRINPHLGYAGSRQFHNAQQALNWVKPPYISEHWPAESFRIKRFNKPLTLIDLKSQSSSWPSHINV